MFTILGGTKGYLTKLLITSFRRLLKLVGVDEVTYNELVEEIVVKREDASYKWSELQPKIIGVLIETYSLPKHNIHLDNISLGWDKMDALIDNIITLGLTPLMQTTHSGT